MGQYCSPKQCSIGAMGQYCSPKQICLAHVSTAICGGHLSPISGGRLSARPDLEGVSQPDPDPLGHLSARPGGHLSDPEGVSQPDLGGVSQPDQGGISQPERGLKPHPRPVGDQGEAHLRPVINCFLCFSFASSIVPRNALGPEVRQHPPPQCFSLNCASRVATPSQDLLHW